MELKVLAYLSGLFATVLFGAPSQVVSNPETFTDKIMGPLGALAICLAGVIFFGRFILKLVKGKDELHQKIIEGLEKQIETLHNDLQEERRKNG